MEILDSAWLIKMLKKSGATPEARMLSLFDILADWVEAPQVRESFQHLFCEAQPLHLLIYLTEEARACGAQLPEALAQQLYYMVLGALKECLHASDISHLANAKLAAAALISVQKESLEDADDIVGGESDSPAEYASKAEYRKSFKYGVAASLAGVLIVGSVAFLNYHHNDDAKFSISQTNLFSHDGYNHNGKNNAMTVDVANPKAAADMFVMMEQMRHGDCHFPEALQIPDAHKRIYIENVVAGQPPKTPEDQAIANLYLAKVNCNYTPMLMKNSTN